MYITQEKRRTQTQLSYWKISHWKVNVTSLQAIFCRVLHKDKTRYFEYATWQMKKFKVIDMKNCLILIPKD